jgi:mono/diheme cytochrome c family protein
VIRPPGSRPGVRRAALVIVLGAALLGCAPGLPQPEPADARAAQTAFPGTTEADLERGRTAYVRRCAACHRLHRPGELPAARWPTMVDKMTARAKLSRTDAADITRYLVVMSRIR